jgi:hypothetical protein
MAWMWWLLAPAGSTVVGAMLLWWRAETDGRQRRWRRRSPIAEHHALLDALERSRCQRRGPLADPEPGNMVLLATPSDYLATPPDEVEVPGG